MKGSREAKSQSPRGGARAVAGGGMLLALLALPGLASRAATPPTAKGTPAVKNAATVSFNRDIRALLSDNCFACHGPDRGKRMANLRLDVREDAITRGAITPGKPQASKLIARVFASDPARAMPPTSAHKQLTPAQKELLRRWIAQGAKYEPHWAFVPLPKSVPLPPVRNAAWCRSPIDRFVLARLEAEHLRPAPEASRPEWLRRVTLDLAGLPPTLAETDAFLADRSPDAYEKVVDRLLASPHYGERMAQPWLDVARYADSYGYQSDQLCPTWPYRDWVVKAFNDNLSYDKFITWQLAGDLLPNATREQRLATAFNRLHRMTNEGGSVPEEWRMEGIADRVATFGTAFLGLTTECARCHDHKYDPISQKDYYSLSAFFNSIDEYGMYDRADIVPSPSLLLPTPEQERSAAAAREGVAQAEQRLGAAREAARAGYAAWLATHPAPVLPDQTGSFDFEAFDGANLRNRVPGSIQNGARSDEVPLVEGHQGKAAQFDGENNVHFPELGRFTRSTPFTIGFWMRDPRIAAEPAVIFQACDGTDAGPHGYDLLIEQGHLTARIFRHWPGNAIAVRTKDALPKDAWKHVAVTYDGSSRAAGLKIYVDGKLAAQEIVRDHLVKGTGIHTLTFGQRFRDRGFKGGRIDDLAIFNRDLTPIEVAQLEDGRSLAEALAHPEGHEAELVEYYRSAIDPPARKAADALTAAWGRLVGSEDAQYEIAVMEAMPQPRPAYLLARGRYDAPQTDATRVGRDVPAAILPFPAGLRRDRLGLAQWLTSPKNPLTARVAVNRIWMLLWGRGLVETAENFGTQGKPPTHPELLDWLALEFESGSSVSKYGSSGISETGQRVGVRTGASRRDALTPSLALAPEQNHTPTLPHPHTQTPWDVKALVKQIVLSSAYRQASALTPVLKEKDPDNLLLARGPSHRLSGEAVRDLALAASGLLDDRMGGPPVSPYQPGDLWRESNTMSPAYHQSTGGDLYRRSLYSVLKRTAPMPDMIAFDAPSREVCTARRQRTNTPLQALILLNDVQFVEAARVLGERTVKEGGAQPEQRVRFAFRTLATREPTAEELRLLTALYESQRALFVQQPADAARLLKIGERKPDPTLPAPEVAAATVLAQAILNLDATIWKR